jgi:hypothetical protein
MTQDEIIEMAKEADATKIGHKPIAFHFYMEALEAFAKLVTEKAREEFGLLAVGMLERTVARAVAKEREACAKVCEAQEDKGGEWDVQQQCANAIRARGQ